ncbi:MAG: hypothetical protein ACYTFQ_28540 [Planctomycetota bacterium]|jgi:hypothetical protein
MAIFTAENADAWKTLGNSMISQKPSPGKEVYVSKGRKHKGKRGVVCRHQRDKYDDTFRYMAPASIAFAQMEGRDGYVCLVRDHDTNRTFWVKASYLLVVEDLTISLSELI